MIATAKPKEWATNFPEKEIEVALVKWWAKEALQRSDDPFSPVPSMAGTI